MRGGIMVRDDEAVSPVIATVLLLAITVLLSSMVFVMMASTLDNVEKAKPKVSSSVRALSNGYHVITITSIDQSIDPAKLEWFIVNNSGQSSIEHTGFVNDPDVYGTVGTNISFHDRDAGWSMTKGDYFVINCALLDCDSGDHFFQVVDTGSNTILIDIKLPNLDN
ncbi:MAG: type IV pilin [Candidatus Poseidoniales archaeon]|nr:MAG: type IV pilin [Candidatus Poseidoniales archaeon]